MVDAPSTVLPPGPPPGLANADLTGHLARSPALFQRTVVERVANWHGVFPYVDLMASDMATVDFACMLAAFLKPKTVVEAGTYRGHMAAALANTFLQMGHQALIYTADPMDFNFLETIAKAPYRHMIRFFNGDYLEMLENVDDRIDLGFIDASAKDNSHMRLEHATATFRRLTSGGLLLVDDTSATDWEDAGVLRKTANIYLAPHRGLSMIQKPYA